MNRSLNRFNKLACIAGILVMAACTTAPPTSEGAVNARSKLAELQADAQLASLIPLEIKEADMAVRAAEKPEKDAELSNHLVHMANRKVDIATALAQSRLLVDQRKSLSQQSDKARLDSRTREADQANKDAASANVDAELARMDANAAEQEKAELQRQIAELNARETDRGLVVTLGDLLFETGKSELKGGTVNNLSKLAAFLNEYKDRTVLIEGHTDSVGSENSNQALSQQRADSVKSYLLSAGINANRLTATGKGEYAPVSDNDSATGRQQNRRVEVIISNKLSNAD